MAEDFSAKEFLRERQAILVHFSTVMGERADLAFPDDLVRATSLRNEPLSFSTILAGDTNPQGMGRGGAEGSVGLVVDVGPSTHILTVLHMDSGSGGLGERPTAENCAASIDRRTDSNEWRVENYEPIGIFVLPPIWVPKSMVLEDQPIRYEVEISFEEAIAPFRHLRIFSANDRGFLEFDRTSGGWIAVAYDDIIAPGTSD